MKHLKILITLFLVGSLGFLSLALAEEQKGEKSKLKVAAVFPGSIQDADYNTLGYMALQEVGKAYSSNVEVAYSERVAVPDVERVMKEYISDGCKIIWVHGAQFNTVANSIGPNYPNVTFVFEVDERPEKALPNFWYMDRQYYVGQYVMGALAGLVTKTRKVGFIGGMNLPFLRGQVHAAKQGIKDIGSSATLQHIHIGDFNDPVKTKNAALGLLSRGVDVFITHLNLGVQGLFSAVKESDKPAFVTVELADKEAQAPKNYLSADLHNFTVPCKEIVGRVLRGEKGGYILMEYGEGKARFAQFPIRNVSQEIDKRVKQIADNVAAGKIKVIKNFGEID